MSDFQWCGAHDDSSNLSTENDYFKSFLYKGDKYKVGDFVLIKENGILRIAKLISLYHSYKKRHRSEPHRGRIQWYMWAEDFRKGMNDDYCTYLKLNLDHEIIQTSELTKNSIALEEIKKKCKVIFAPIYDPIFKVERNKFKFDIYCCRYKLDGDLVVPFYESFHDNEILSESDSFNSTTLSFPSNSPFKRKSDCTPIKVDSSELEVPLKNLKLTPEGMLAEIKNYTKISSAKRVLIDSFDESSKVSYSIIKNKCDNESIKVTLKVNDSKDNVKVHPTILTEEIVKMRSPIKLRHIQKIDNKIELSKEGRIELNGTAKEFQSDECFTPRRTPAKISVRRSTRTVEKKSYKEFYESDSRSSSKPKDSPFSGGERQRRAIRIPKRYADSHYLTGSVKSEDRIRPISPKETSAKKSIIFENASDKCAVEPPKRKSQRTIKPSVRYLESSTIKGDESINVSNKKSNVDYKDVSSDDDDDFLKTKLKRNLRRTPSRQLNEIDDSLKTPKSLKSTSTPRTKDTPSARAKLVRDGVITPSVQCREKAVVKDNTPLSIARNQLHVSYVPKGLPCREQEYLGIANFLKGKLLDGCGGCMYVSGVPGTGKTATVTEVVNSLQQLTKTGKVSPFTYVNINGMRLSEPRQAYVEIAKQLLGKTMRWEQAQSTLENMFVKNKKKSSPIVMVIDELDILCTKRQDVVYNLLDWPTKTNSQLIVITIANTMDLPERLLMGRVTSRLGLTRLTFQAYTHKQLQEIVTKRLIGTNAFNPDAIQLVARKVASVSGDARRALDICRRAAEIAELEGKYTLVSMKHVNEALNSMITQPKVQAIKHCSNLEKLILQSVVAEVERTGVEETNFTKVYRMLSTIAAVDAFEMVSRTTVILMIARLGASRLLLTDQKCNDTNQRIILNASTDDIHYALMMTDI
ncbi:hypothetical protein FQR65_LT08964 [Abscondita terminalis]|nr:hypothetical protein FQR65_LT08964 [Abscondita terminalis]